MNDNPVVETASIGNILAAGQSQTELLLNRQRMAAARRYEDRKAVREKGDRLKQQGLFFALDDPAQIAERAARKTGQAQASLELMGAVARVADVPARSLPAAFERVIGRNDLLPIAYFLRGTLAAGAVGRVVTKDEQGREVSYGTAFLVAPDVVITNHHVLPDADTAARSIIQFNYQTGIDGQMEHFLVAPVDPARYLSNEDLDFALVGIVADAGVRPKSILPLIGSRAKIINDEAVSIIQHPGAQPKQVALRDNKVIDLLPDFLHYTTDTEPGASGSPVFNDQWEVVALHHAGVPGTGPAAGGAGGDQVTWVANEGVRVSRIVSYLKELSQLSPAVQQMVSSVLGQDTVVPLSHSPEAVDGRLPPLVAPAANQAEDKAPQSQARLAMSGACVTEITINVRPADGQATSEPMRGEGFLSNLVQPARAAAISLADQAMGMVGARRPLPDFIQRLEEGDVLLYSGTGLLSDAIKFFTNSDVSHVGLYLGGAGSGMIGEAVDAGVIRDTREQSFPGHNWVVVHRLRDKRDMAPVLNRGNYYLDQRLRYAYPQLVFLAMLLLLKRVRPSGVLGKMVQAVSVAAAEALNRFLESGKELMICSEFVYRAFDEAVPGPSNPFHLAIQGIAREAYGPAAAYPGVEEGSIAMTLLADKNLLQSGFNEAAASVGMQWPLNQELLEKQAETLIAEYMAEVRFGRPPRESASGQAVTDAKVAEAVSRFAIALAAVRRQAAGAGREEALSAATQPAAVAQVLPPALQALFSSPADFVTPADLRLSPSLVEVGRIF